MPGGDPRAQFPAQQPWQVPAQQSWQAPPPFLTCRICGCAPAAKVTFRGHQGLILIARFLSVPGPFCRNCGLATFRRMTANTLVAGWWGVISLFATPATILINLVRRQKVAALPEPQRVPGVAGALAPYPLDPGQPLLNRPQTFVFYALVVGICLLGILANM
jgi:hypothetical protein